MTNIEVKSISEQLIANEKGLKNKFDVEITSADRTETITLEGRGEIKKKELSPV